MIKFQTFVMILGLLGILLVFQNVIIMKHEEQGKTWVLLVGGSQGIENYRHQADVYHAYHLIREGGIKEENIIVFHYNDIAEDERNPFVGTVLHEHGGRDFYPGVPWDYIGTDVNSRNVLAVLAGNNQKVGDNKKVIMSNSKDTIFVFWSGHGQTDHLLLGDVITKKQLTKTLLRMRKKNRFKAMVLYIGACHNGCLFEPVHLEDKRIYAITSSNCSQPSHSTKKDWYGPATGYLSWATQFGRAWICDSEEHDRIRRSVGEQFDEVKRNVTKSTVLEFGSKELKDDKLFRYQGFKKERDHCYHCVNLPGAYKRKMRSCGLGIDHI